MKFPLLAKAGATMPAALCTLLHGVSRPRFGWRRLWASIGLVVAGIVMFAVPYWGLAFVLYQLAVWLLFAVIVMYSLCMAVTWLVRGDGARAKAESTTAVLVLALGIAMPSLTLFAGDFLQLAIVYPQFATQIDALASDAGPRIVTIETDSALLMSHGIAYDDSDEIMLAPERRSASWTAHARTSRFAMECWGVRHLIGHYYVWGGDGACE
jgi:hypothetical protein